MLMNNEYEKLAKLLYPSIEASGNVYYGQTRKLSLDELFDKNNGGFESWIDCTDEYDNFNNTEPTEKQPFISMCWKLGPFSGCINIDQDIFNTNIQNFQDFTDIFAKYKIGLSTVKKDNILQSGDFNTYEVNATCSFVDYVVTNGVSPVNAEDILNNDITFCIDNKNKYLYIRLVVLDENNEVADYTKNDYLAANVNQPLTFTCITDGYIGLHLPFVDSDSVDSHFNTYEYSLNGGKWTHWKVGTSGYHPDIYEDIEVPYQTAIEWADLEPIQMSKDDVLKVRCYGDFIFNNLNTYHATSCAHFLFSGTYNVSGNAFSMTRGTEYANVTETEEYELMHLFSDNGYTYPSSESHIYEYYHYSHTDDNIQWDGGIVDASALALPATTLSNGCYKCMFQGCNTLTKAPKLPATELAESCYRSMFAYCSNLENVPVLPAVHFDENCENCYAAMFYKCTSLKTTHYFICDSIIDIANSNFFDSMYYDCTDIENVFAKTTNNVEQPIDNDEPTMGFGGWWGSIFGMIDDNGYNTTDMHLYHSYDAILTQNAYFVYSDSLSTVDVDNQAKEFKLLNEIHKNTAKLCLRQPLKEVTTFGYNNDDYKPEYDDNDNFKNPVVVNDEFKKGGLQQIIYGRKEFVNPIVFDNGIYMQNGFIADTEYENSDDSIKDNFTISTINKTDSIVLQSGAVEIKADSIKPQSIEIINIQRKETTDIEYNLLSTYDGPSDVEDFVILAAASYMMTTIYIAGFADDVVSIFSLLLQLANGDIDKNQFDQSIAEITGVSVDKVDEFFAALVVGMALTRFHGEQYANTLYITGEKITYKVASVEECEAYYTNNIDYTQTTIPIVAACIDNILTFISDNKSSIKYSLYSSVNLGENSCSFFNTYTNSIYCDNYYYANGDPVRFCECTPSLEPETRSQQATLYIEFDSASDDNDDLNSSILSLDKNGTFSVGSYGTVVFDGKSVSTKIDYGDTFASNETAFMGKTLKFKSRPNFEYIKINDEVVEVTDKAREATEQLEFEAAFGAALAKVEQEWRTSPDNINNRRVDTHLADMLKAAGFDEIFPKYYGHIKGGNTDIKNVITTTSDGQLTKYSDVYKNANGFKVTIYDTCIEKSNGAYSKTEITPIDVDSVADAKNNNPFAIIAENEILVSKQIELMDKDSLLQDEENELAEISMAVKTTNVDHNISVNKNIINTTLSNAVRIKSNTITLN